MNIQHHGFIFYTAFTTILLSKLADCANFSELFEPYWASDHIVANEGKNVLELKLYNVSGCGFGSKKKYMYGKVSMDIKLVEGDSAGTVTAFYMSSEGPNHNELDFEFLGNVSGEPYLLQTNMYINGTGNREQRHTLWFDPTISSHTYSFLWTRNHLRFLVDSVPVRIHINTGSNPYPNDQAMGIYASVWNADDWATQGGSVKTDWSHAPFVTEVGGFGVDGCAVGECDAEGEFWWDGPGWKALNPHERRQLKWVRAKHLVYDYCKDFGRFGGGLPGECSA